MTPSIGVQLWSVRELINKDFKGTLKKIAQIGYEGVELAGFYDKTPQEATGIFKELGLTPLGLHHGLSSEKENEKAFQTAKDFGIKRFIVPYISAEDFNDMKKVKALCDSINQAAPIARKFGLSMGFHNHWWEFNQLSGKVGFDILVEMLNPEVFFEVDTYWSQTGGADTPKLLGRLGKRAPLLHIKDGPVVKNDPGRPNVALGEGAMDIPALVQGANGNTEWMVVEFDHCATDMMEGLQKSYDYLVKNKLAGKKGGKP